MDKVIGGNGVRKTALAIARGLGKKLLREDSTYNTDGKVLLNWGKSSHTGLTGSQGATFINDPSAVLLASTKIASLELLGAEYAVEVTTDNRVANDWTFGGYIVIARDLERANGGRGITVYEAGSVVGNHRFYTKYFKAVDEYRIHVGKNQQGQFTVIDCQRKSLRTDEERPENPNFIVRNHDNGFIFERGVDVPNDVKAVSMAAVEALGLDFGAVDIRRNRNGDIKVLEVNTAPGLTGTTLENYINFFNESWS